MEGKNKRERKIRKETLYRRRESSWKERGAIQYSTGYTPAVITRAQRRRRRRRGPSIYSNWVSLYGTHKIQQIESRGFFLNVLYETVCKLWWTEQLEAGRKSKKDKSPVSESALQLLYLWWWIFPSLYPPPGRMVEERGGGMSSQEDKMGILKIGYYHDFYLYVITSSSLLKPGVLLMELIINGVSMKKRLV